uniref:Uncharacterized protein n=1 Tax=Tanacetum cinerariifolium TaxID=118510 RepID=A0A6L2MGX4_TANCI|nr:hypothetical protein [Tanacetum cinerariifolium]
MRADHGPGVLFRPGDLVKEKQEKDKIGTKPDKNGKHGKARQVKSAGSNFGAVAGDRTRVTRVPGGNTYHYTTTTACLTLLMNLPTFSTHLHNLLYILVNFAEAMLNMVTTVRLKFRLSIRSRVTVKTLTSRKISMIFNNSISVVISVGARTRLFNIPACCDDDDDYNSTITPVLSTEETDNSLSMGDEHLDTISATESDEVIKSSVEDLVPIPTKDHFEIALNSNDDISSSDDNSLYNENIEYVEASPHDSELVSLKAAEIVIPEVEEIEDDNLCEKLLNFPPTDRSDLTHEEFADELAHIISLPEYDCFYFRNFLDPGELISILNFEIRENLSTTSVNLPVEDYHSPLLAYVVWIFLAYLTYPVIPPYLHPFGNEDTIFDPDITINRVYSFKPGLSHRCGAFKKFNTHCSHLNEWPMIINGKNTPILDVLLFHFYPP